MEVMAPVNFCEADKKKDKSSISAVGKATNVDAAPKTPTTPTKPSKVTTATGPSTPSTSAAAQSAATAPLGVSLEKVDLGKISSILSSLTSAMKNTGVLCCCRESVLKLLKTFRSSLHIGTNHWNKKQIKKTKQHEPVN